MRNTFHVVAAHCRVCGTFCGIPVRNRGVCLRCAARDRVLAAVRDDADSASTEELEAAAAMFDKLNERGLMSRYYSDPSRENDTYSLPNVEVFYVDSEDVADDSTEFESVGWYYWFCFSGRIPDSSAFGPYESEEAAVAAMRDEHGPDEPTDMTLDRVPIETEPCPACDGTGLLLGVLGTLKYFRCRNCGAEFSCELPKS